MTMTLPAPTPAPAGRVSHALILCAVAALTGLIEAVAGALDLVLVGDIANAPDLSPGGLMRLAPMVAHVLLGLAAPGCAVTGRPRVAIAALAVWALARWAGEIPSLLHGQPGLSEAADTVAIGVMLFGKFGQPLLCVASLAAAWRNRALAAATLGVALMTVFDLAAITMFAIGVSLYGA